MRRLALATALLLAACSSAPQSECDDQRPCPSGQVCVQHGSCAGACNFDGGGCAPGTSCQATGPYCPENGSCPAIAVLACLQPDGGP